MRKREIVPQSQCLDCIQEVLENGDDVQCRTIRHTACITQCWDTAFAVPHFMHSWFYSLGS